MSSKGYRRRQGKNATYGYYKSGLRTAELKYFDYDAGISSNQATLAGWNSGAVDFSGYPLVLTNYPKAVDVSTQSINNADMGIFIINKIQQGTDIYARIGREVIMKSLYVRLTVWTPVQKWLTLNNTSVNTTYNTSIRVMVIYDTQTNNVAESSMSLQQILKVSTDATTGGGAGPIASGFLTAFINLDYRDRWNVIYDKIFDVGNTQGIGAKSFKIYKKFGKGGLPVTYTGNTGTTINTGALWVVIGGNNADANIQVPAVADTGTVRFAWSMTSRIRFTDS